MTNEELVLMAKTDKGKLEELIKKNTGIVRKIASKYFTAKTASMDMDDLIQEGYIGFMRAVELYDPGKENATRFINYAAYHIRAKISRFVQQKNTNDQVSLNKPIHTGETDVLELQDMIEDPDNMFDRIERFLYYRQIRKELEEVMGDYLTLLEREILKMHFGWNGEEEMTIAEIANLFKTKFHLINTRKNAAILKIRRSKWGSARFREHYGEKMRKKYYSVDSFIHTEDYRKLFSYMLDE